MIDTSHLIHDPDGNVVPWITRWTGEVHPRRVQVTLERVGLVASYGDELPDNRDDRGILWQREGISRTGRPQWAHINTYRQRASVRKGLCQVCGKKIENRPVNWLITKSALMFKDDIALTTSAPTCDACIPIALELCPHFLNSDERPLLGKVLEWAPAGVFGTAYVRHPDTGEIEPIGEALYPYGSSAINPQAVIAQQEVVRWIKYTYDTYEE